MRTVSIPGSLYPLTVLWRSQREFCEAQCFQGQLCTAVSYGREQAFDKPRIYASHVSLCGHMAGARAATLRNLLHSRAPGMARIII